MLKVSAERLRLEMLSRGMTNVEMAAAAKISKACLERMKRSDAKCNYKTIHHVARALGIEPTELLTFNNRKDD